MVTLRFTVERGSPEDSESRSQSETASERDDVISERREVDGTVETDEQGNTVLVSSSESRPNFRVEQDNTVTLISEKAEVEIPEFGTDAQFDGYCQRHEVKNPTGYDNCPMCQEESRIEAAERERQLRHAPRSYDDPASTSSYDAW